MLRENVAALKIGWYDKAEEMLNEAQNRMECHKLVGTVDLSPVLLQLSKRIYI
jgi:hypothetical protein